MGNVTKTTQNSSSSDSPGEVMGEQSLEIPDASPAEDSKPGLSEKARSKAVTLKSALKTGRASFAYKQPERKLKIVKKVQFNLADVEIRDLGDPKLSPPPPGYGLNFLGTTVWPGRDDYKQPERKLKNVQKEVRFNLADVEIREGNPKSPPAPGYGLNFLGLTVWPGRDQAGVAEAGLKYW